MKAMVMGGLGLSNLALRDVPDPKPGPGQVLVRMRAASLNFRDLLTLDGKYGGMQKRENLILLSDGAGEIAELGVGVREWKVGDRVVGGVTVIARLNAGQTLTAAEQFGDISGASVVTGLN